MQKKKLMAIATTIAPISTTSTSSKTLTKARGDITLLIPLILSSAPAPLPSVPGEVLRH